MVEMSPITLAVIILGVVLVVAAPNWIALFRPGGDEAGDLARYTEQVARIWDFVHNAEQIFSDETPGAEKRRYVLEQIAVYLPDLNVDLASIIIESVVNQMKAERNEL